MVAVIAAIIGSLGLAKRGRGKRKFRRYIRGRIQNRFNLSTLGSITAISDTIDDVLTESAWLSSIVATWSMDNFTVGVGDGPIQVGVAHSDYSDAEILAWILGSESWASGDMVAQEINRRRIRRVGTFDQTGPALSVMTLNDGKPIRTKCGWQLVTGQTLRVWAFNSGSSALATTDPAVMTAGHANLWPN